MELIRYSRDELIEFGITPSLATFATTGKHAFSDLEVFVRPIREEVDYFIPPEVESLIGLWSEFSDAYARWTRSGSIEFVVLYHDEPSHKIVAWTEQGLLADLAKRYFWTLDWNNEIERSWYWQFVECTGFRYGPELIQKLLDPAIGEDADTSLLSMFGRLP